MDVVVVVSEPWCAIVAGGAVSHVVGGCVCDTGRARDGTWSCCSHVRALTLGWGALDFVGRVGIR